MEKKGKKLPMPQISFPLGSEKDPELEDCIAYRGVNDVIYIAFNEFVEEFTYNLLRKEHFVGDDGTDNEDLVKRMAHFAYLDVAIDALRVLN